MKIETGKKVKARFDFDRFQRQLSGAVLASPNFRVLRLTSKFNKRKIVCCVLWVCPWVAAECFSSLFAATEEICKKGTKKAQFVLKPWNDNQQPGQRRSSDRILIVCAINAALLGYPKMDGL